MKQNDENGGIMNISPTQDNEEESCDWYLNSSELISKLREHPQLKNFWTLHGAGFDIRKYPSILDPLFEVQLSLDISERHETYAWAWIDAITGEFVKIIFES